jgi:class 3 adenylate cyclase/pimeloyl-ACP methyl ester carboxylesterase
MGIAFWEIGSGPALVIVQNLVLSHAEMEWSVPIMRAWYLELARYFRVIRIDLRGSGLSDDPPSVDFFTLAGFGQDIAAVVTALRLENFSLMGISSMGPTAVQYAVDHPEQVLGLVLCDTGPVLSDLPLHRYAQAFSASFKFEMTPSFDSLSNELTPEDRRATTALITAARVGREHAGHDWTGSEQFDVSGLLLDVKASTLVIKPADSLLTDQEQTRRLVVGIPVAQMRVVPGVMAPFMTDSSPVVEALVDFLTSGDYQPAADADDDELRTIVFTDLVSSTELLNRLGDTQGRSEVRSVEAAITDLCTQHHGRLVKNLGDGSLVSFKSTRRALLFAIDLQARMDESPFGMRIGLAAGEPIQEDGDIHGAVVVQASRIADLGNAGETIVSDSVRLLSVGKDFSFESWGEIQLKGFDELSTLWKVTKPPRP